MELARRAARWQPLWSPSLQLARKGLLQCGLLRSKACEVLERSPDLGVRFRRQDNHAAHSVHNSDLHWAGSTMGIG